jgi:hypothetical protein
LKRLLFIPNLILLTISLSGCYLFQSERSESPIEMTAFSSLNDEEQDQIPVSPKDSVVRKVTVNEDLAKFIGKTYYGKEVYSVTFNHTETDSTGNVTVYVDLDKKTIVGKGFSEQTDDKSDEQAFVDQFMGIWRSVDDNQYIMELKDNVETIGINESEMLSRAEFTIIESNLDEQYLVISGKTTNSYDDNTEEFITKLELMDNGNKLQYNYNYDSNNKQTLWIR